MCSLERIVVLLPYIRLYVCLSWTGVHCDHTVQVSADFSLWSDSRMFWASWHQSMSTYSQLSFPVYLEERWGMDVQTRRDISRMVELEERLSYYWVLIRMPHRLTQQYNGCPWVTLNGHFTVCQYHLFTPVTLDHLACLTLLLCDFVQSSFCWRVESVQLFSHVVWFDKIGWSNFCLLNFLIFRT